MIALQVLHGKRLGLNYQTGRFPFTVGRSAEDEMQLPDQGVWDRHLSITLTSEGYHFQTADSALLLVNSQRATSGRLRNGDLLEIGGAKIQFLLAAALQPSLAIRETKTWLVWFCVLAFQLWALFRWLPKGAFDE